MKVTSLKKTIITAVIVIGTSALLFQGFIHIVTAAELNKANTVPTSYEYDSSSSPEEALNRLPVGYQKANYTVEEIDLEYYRNQTPTKLDMTKEEAAELGAQALWEVFGVSLEDQVIQLGYQPGNARLPRSSWYGDVYIDGQLAYYFDLDSVTGELFGIGRNRTLDQEVALGFDLDLAQNAQEYVEQARELAESLDVVPSPIKAVEYGGQGVINNDPTIQIHVMGENGELAIMAFSRYDHSLVSIGYSTPNKYAREHDEKMMKQLQDIGVEPRRDRSTEEVEQDTLYLGEIIQEHFGGSLELRNWEDWDEFIEELREIVERENRERD